MTDLPVVALDYADLRIYATSRMEREVRARSAAKESETTLWIESFRRGEVFWDVGANIGAYSLMAATLGVKVWAFEPAWQNYERLVQNASLNGLDIVCLPVGLSDHAGVTRMQLSSDEPGAASHVFGYEGDGFAWKVPTLRLDDLGLAPDHLKVDVDGHELQVLRGGPACLAQVESLLVEVTDCTYSETVGMCAEAGLRLAEEHPHLHSGVTNLILRRS